jgi:ATP-binding cassette subfamily C protein LapB
MLHEPLHHLKNLDHRLNNAKIVLSEALRRQALDFLPSQWTLACAQQTTTEQAVGEIVKAYLKQCNLPHTTFEQIQANERHHLPEDALCITAKGELMISNTVPKGAQHWPLQCAFVLEVSEHTGTSNPQQSTKHSQKGILEFWKSLRASPWLRESIGESLKDLRPVIYASVLINLLALAGPFFSIQVYDRIIPNSAFASLTALLIGVALCLGFEHTLKHARHRLMEHAATVADTRCSQKLSDALLSVRTNQTEPAVLLQHLRSFEQLREIITGVFLLALIDLPFLALFLLVIGIIHPLFLLITSVAIALTLLSIVSSHRALAEQSKKQLNAFRESQNQWLDALANLELIQTTGVQSPYAKALNKIQLKSRLENNSIRSLMFDFSQHLYLLQQGCWVLTIALGVYLAVNQQVSIGGMIAVSMLTMRCFGPIQRLQSQLTQTHSAQASFEDLDKFLSKPIETRAHPNALPSVQHIELEGIQVLKPGRPANSTVPSDFMLRNVTMNLQAGDHVGVIGPMGSGKTTLLKLLAMQLDLHTGSFRVNHLDKNHYPLTEYAQHLGVAMQPPLLVKGTLLENIQFKRPWIDAEDCVKALQSIGMEHWLNHHPDGLHMRIENQGSNLSAGQRQAVSLARALAGRPQLLLLDEPTVCLDQHAENKLIQTLQQLPSHVTLVLTTHKLNLLSACKTLVLVNEGQPIAQGEKATVLHAANELMKQRDAAQG